MGESVSGSKLAKIIGFSRQTIIKWTREGMPVKKAGGKGKETVYDTAEVISWLVGRGASAKDPGLVPIRRRLLEIEANRREIHLARERGESVDIGDVLKTWTSRIQGCRGRLLGLPSRIAPEIVGCNSIAEVHALIQQHVYEALDELSEGRTYEQEGEPDGN
jgi:phage terminase Nu1 subunit (DNA packaging protein)